MLWFVGLGLLLLSALVRRLHWPRTETPDTTDKIKRLEALGVKRRGTRTV